MDKQLFFEKLFNFLDEHGASLVSYEDIWVNFDDGDGYDYRCDDDNHVLFNNENTYFIKKLKRKI